MDIFDRIVEAVAQKLISLRLNEEEGDPMDTPKGDLIRRTHGNIKFKKAIGPNNKRDTLGSNSEGNPDYTSAGSDASEKKSGLPLNINTKSKRGAKVNPDAVRGKSINTSRSTGQEAAKAAASQTAFNNFVSKLARRGGG